MKQNRGEERERERMRRKSDCKRVGMKSQGAKIGRQREELKVLFPTSEKQRKRKCKKEEREKEVRIETILLLSTGTLAREKREKKKTDGKRNRQEKKYRD